MTLSSVYLNNPQSVWLDGEAKSVAYFCKRNPVRVGAELIEELKAMAARSGRNVRLCLHDKPSAAFHEMIILEHAGSYYRPHKHRGKGESYHVIEGSMAAFVFDEAGRVVDACRLAPGADFLYRVGADTYHGVLPLTDQVVYHESKPGPFGGEADSLYPAWAPDGSREAEVAEFRGRLLRALGA